MKLAQLLLMYQLTHKSEFQLNDLDFIDNFLLKLITGWLIKRFCYFLLFGFSEDNYMI